MKKCIMAVAAMMLLAGIAYADEYVNGYYRSNGTYVNGYTRSSPDSSYNNNYSTRGNTNPYTGYEGTRTPTYNDRTPEYNQRTYGNSGYDYSGSTSSSSTRRGYGY